MRQHHQKSNSSLRIAYVFILCIVLLVAGGFLLKLFLVLRASTFDGTHQYILEIDEGNRKGALVSFNPNSSVVTILHVSGGADKSYGRYLGVPVDGSVVMDDIASPSKLVANLLLHASHERGITVIDKLRLLLFVNALKPADFHETAIQLPIDSSVSEKLLPSLFLDNTLYTDNESIAIINATGESGIGSEVARQLTTIGMSVISVTTSLQDQKDTVITAVHTNTYTVQRIERLFHVDATTSTKQGISDITVTIGKESLSAIE